MPYTAEHPPTPSSDEERARIPGWGADLDPADRPSVPRLKLDPAATGAHWHFPKRQPEKWPRERSIGHEFLTPPPATTSSPVLDPAPRKSNATAITDVVSLAVDRDTLTTWFHRYPPLVEQLLRLMSVIGVAG
jgi:hypothetical protein